MVDFVDSKAEEDVRPLDDDKVEVFSIEEDKHLLTVKPPECCRSLLELNSFLPVWKEEEGPGPPPCLLHGSSWFSEICRLKLTILLDWSNLFSIRPEESDDDRRLLEVDIRDEVSRDEVSILNQLSVSTYEGNRLKSNYLVSTV